MNKITSIKYMFSILFYFGVGYHPLMAMDVTEQMEKLKNNSENSEANFQQYSKNHAISRENVKVISSAIKDLGRLKNQIISNRKNVKKNKLALAQNKQKIQTFKLQESKMLEEGDKQILELRELTQKLEKAQEQRRLNIQAYETRLTEIQKEEQNWDEQRKKEEVLLGEINDREVKANSEKAKWEAKGKDYAKESGKWKGYSKEALNTYNRYKNLND